MLVVCFDDGADEAVAHWVDMGFASNIGEGALDDVALADLRSFFRRGTVEKIPRVCDRYFARSKLPISIELVGTVGRWVDSDGHRGRLIGLQD